MTWQVLSMNSRAESEFVFEKILYVLACVVLPVLWGVFVNWLFTLWASRSSDSDDEPVFPDYQI